jgi:phospholipase/carboxylesterase
VLLHGIGADEHDLLGLAPALDPRFFVVSVRAPLTYRIGHAWYEIDYDAVPPRADLAQAEASRALLEAELPALQTRHGTDPARTFLLGFSQGAILALGLALSRPELVAGLVLHSGRVLPPFATPPPTPERLAHVSALVVHGTSDDVIPVERGRDVAALLAPALGDRLTFREHAAGHEVTPATLRELSAWLAARLG